MGGLMPQADPEPTEIDMLCAEVDALRGALRRRPRNVSAAEQEPLDAALEELSYAILDVLVPSREETERVG